MIIDNPLTYTQKPKVKKPKEIRLSDHAIARYVERILKIPMQEIKNMLLTREEEALMLKMGDGKYPLKSGGFAIVENWNIKTIVENKIFRYKGKK